MYVYIYIYIYMYNVYMSTYVWGLAPASRELLGGLLAEGLHGSGVALATAPLEPLVHVI